MSSFGNLNLDELTSGSGGGSLPIILSLVTSSAVMMDLSAHQDALQLAGNLFAGNILPGESGQYLKGYYIKYRLAFLSSVQGGYRI